jgi:hypothetical protein
MRKMSMPGYTAEASLHKVSRDHQMARVFARLDRGVIPQQGTGGVVSAVTNKVWGVIGSHALY